MIRGCCAMKLRRLSILNEISCINTMKYSTQDALYMYGAIGMAAIGHSLTTILVYIYMYGKYISSRCGGLGMAAMGYGLTTAAVVGCLLLAMLTAVAASEEILTNNNLILLANASII